MTQQTSDVIDWLLDSDPAIRWQVMRDITGAPAEEVAAERARIAKDGWGARLLTKQREDGQWDAGAPTFKSENAQKWWDSLPSAQKGTLFPEWTSTAWSLMLLRWFGLQPRSDEAQTAVSRVRDNVRWEHDAEPFFAGEVEPCINGKVVAMGSYYGIDVDHIVERLLTEQMSDGGWNCEQENGATVGSFHTTIDVLDGLLEYERARGRSTEVEAARLRGHEYLLSRRMFRRLSTGEIVDQAFTQFSFPTYWHYDVLRGLDHLRAAGAAPDGRMAEAIELVEAKRDSDGRWPLEHRHPGSTYFDMDDGEGSPSRWNTLRAMRVLRWYRQAQD